MTESSTICIGSELFAVLADLRARGCDVWSLDTDVGGKNSQYRVSFSERVTEESLSVSGRNRNAGHAGPAALTNFPVNVLTESQVCEIPDEQAAGVINRTLAGCLGEAQGGTLNTPAAGNSTSIETRIKNLYEKAVKSGRVRTRFQTTTKPEHARLPHPND